MFRTLISVGVPLKYLLRHASRVFAESTLPTQYATLVCGRALSNGRVEISNAGHPLPLIVRDGEVTPLEGSDLPVGIFSDSEFSVTELCLEPGQSLLIYSDGVSEATDDSGAEYGAERLQRLIGGTHLTGSTELVAACRDDLAAFRGNRRSDDATLFVLTRTGPDAR
jgi:sigma-B regulation protein RsbU (phosphoserine phosphatase)